MGYLSLVQKTVAKPASGVLFMALFDFITKWNDHNDNWFPKQILTVLTNHVGLVLVCLYFTLRHSCLSWMEKSEFNLFSRGRKHLLYSQLLLVSGIICTLHLQLSFAQFVHVNLAAALLQALIKIQWRNGRTEHQKLSSSQDMLNKQRVTISTPEVICSHLQSMINGLPHSSRPNFPRVSRMPYKLHLHKLSILCQGKENRRGYQEQGNPLFYF